MRALGEASLYPRANSWYMGANVPGKPRVLLPYVGGADRYRAFCERIVAAGYAGFATAPAPRKTSRSASERPAAVNVVVPGP